MSYMLADYDPKVDSMKAMLTNIFNEILWIEPVHMVYALSKKANSIYA